jgi:pyruvate/2-oxoacid:ferredoxin oxidoreductase alpha subunit
MQEGISYMASAELPCVIADIMRGGPGLGNIAPEQGDYMQVVKGGGHGCYHTLVLAPDSVQEMCDLTGHAFELADRYRNPVFVLADGFIGQMMEPVEFPEHAIQPPSRKNLVTSIYLDPDDLELHIRKLAAKYERAESEAVRFEAVETSDADLVLVGYGIVARVLKSVVRLARAEGLRVGLVRPITLYPFPKEQIHELARRAAAFLAVELSTGQMVEDVRLAVNGAKPVEFYGRVGGNVPSAEEVLRVVHNLAERYSLARKTAPEAVHV